MYIMPTSNLLEVMDVKNLRLELSQKNDLRLG